MKWAAGGVARQPARLGARAPHALALPQHELVGRLHGVAELKAHDAELGQGRVDGGEGRLAAMPTVPTFTEAGMVGFGLTSVTAMVGPAKVPRAIINKINADIGAVLALPATTEFMAKQGAEPFTSTPEQTAVVIRDELARYAKIIKAAGIVYKP